MRIAYWCLPLLLASERVQATWIESLVMPGDVVAKHAHLERECAKCHEPFDKGAQSRLCRACHTDVAADVDGGRGFHGRDESVGNRACPSCHTEHKGRAADIVRLDPKRFDHRATDFALRGKHVGVACEACHVAGKRRREASTLCNDCHARTDPHAGSLGARCANCHDESAWKTVRFDHQSTEFPLEGRHRETRCDRCHDSKRYTETATRCAACHARDDKHRGSLGNACQSCHTPRKWSGTGFDHARRTHFPLLGRHSAAACDKCHSAAVAVRLTPTACRSCHERDDAHHGQFGAACESCHTPVDWRRPTFEHSQRTRYPLRGRHAEIRCTDCHRGDLHTLRLDPSCYACHRNDDVHHGSEGAQCANCHDEHGWSRRVLFDHASTAFPLTGAHARIACTQCHQSSFKNIARECVACHAREDVHHGKEGPQCERCHDAATFRVARDPR
ncbi:MAG TPA: cytochrome c3 family protein [Candidatus Binatia bacterium]|nr:cytochrome c3 family protein [Candidatus Binatia bacterium]